MSARQPTEVGTLRERNSYRYELVVRHLQLASIAGMILAGQAFYALLEVDVSYYVVPLTVFVVFALAAVYNRWLMSPEMDLLKEGY